MIMQVKEQKPKQIKTDDEIITKEDIMPFVKEMFTDEFLKKLEVREDNLITKPSFDLFDLQRIGFMIKQQTALATLKETLKWINEHKELFGKADYSYADLQIAEYLEAEIKRLEGLEGTK